MYSSTRGARDLPDVVGNPCDRKEVGELEAAFQVAADGGRAAIPARSERFHEFRSGSTDEDAAIQL